LGLFWGRLSPLPTWIQEETPSGFQELPVDLGEQEAARIDRRRVKNRQEATDDEIIDAPLSGAKLEVSRGVRGGNDGVVIADLVIIYKAP